MDNTISSQRPCYVSVTHKNNSSDFYCSQPTTLEIDNRKIEDVCSYVTHNYQDAETNNGKLYNINRSNGNRVRLYTGDGKFLRSVESFHSTDNIEIGGRRFFGYITKTTLPDKKEIYEVTNKLGFIRNVVVNADGSVILPKRNVVERLAAFLGKKI